MKAKTAMQIAREHRKQQRAKTALMRSLTTQPRRSNGTILQTPRKANGAARMIDTDRELAAEGRLATITLTRDPEDGKNVAKFHVHKPWAPGQVNGTIYLPLDQAEGVTAVVVTIAR